MYLHIRAVMKYHFVVLHCVSEKRANMVFADNFYTSTDFHFWWMYTIGNLQKEGVYRVATLLGNLENLEKSGN